LFKNLETTNNKRMIDTHIHIGKFNEVYYEPVEIMRIIEDSGVVTGCCFSSTSMGEPGITYKDVEKEIQSILKVYSEDVMRPYFWFFPGYIQQGISVESAMNGLPYKGFKIHTRDEWNFENDTLQTEVLHQIFGYANRHDLPILIHTGESDIDRPNRLEPFFKAYPNVKSILAHCRPANKTIEMFQRYKNVYGDTAFAPKERIKEIVDAGYADRIFGGTDFPITNYFDKKFSNSKISLNEQYQKDIIDYLLIKKI